MDSKSPVDTVFISCSCNRVPHCLDWGKNGLICYGSCHSVAIYNPEFSGTAGRVLSTLYGHKGRVNSVRWIRHPHNSNEIELLSTSTDNTGIIWRKIEGTERFAALQTLEGHTDIVTVGHAVYVSPMVGGDLILATASADSTLKIWTRKQGDVSCTQTVNLKGGFAMDVKLTFLPQTSTPILAYGGDDTMIHLMVYQNGVFEKFKSLRGHEDWIRCLDFCVTDFRNLLLSSCSQDSTIRIWNIQSKANASIKLQESSPLDEIKLHEEVFSVTDIEGSKHSFAVSLDAVLAGHENWVYGLQWHPPVPGNGASFKQPLMLLSSAMDKTMILWQPDADTGVWLEKVRVGEVGGNTLGFLGCRFGPTGTCILSHGYQGALHLWRLNQETENWEPGITAGGHFDEVCDLAWDPDGEYVLSVSQDQTARIHAPWKQAHKQQVTWHELARPQVHGHGLSCLAIINRYCYVSGADEKVIRAFQAPRNFIENLATICHLDLADILAQKSYAKGASVPALGLSNKAVYDEQDLVEESVKQDKVFYPTFYFKPIQLTEPTTEDNLLQNTLWPEVQKLYGHGFEIFSLSSNHKGTIIASACKATKTEHGAILLWDVTTWKVICSLQSHSLTVTQLAFSPDDQYLLSVSRDRTWSLFQNTTNNQSDMNYKRVAYSDKRTSIHARIIWASAWTHDGLYFCTGSRDKKVVIWGRTSRDVGDTRNCLGDFGASSQPLDLPDSVTAVAFAPCFLKHGSYLLAVGLELGSIILHEWDSSTGWKQLYNVQKEYAHHLDVKRLAFRPRVGCAGQKDDFSVLQLASCSSDASVRIYNIQLDAL